MAEAKRRPVLGRLVAGAKCGPARGKTSPGKEDWEDETEPRIGFIVYEGPHRSDGGVASLWLLISGMDREKCFIVTSREDGRAAAWRNEGYRVYVVGHWRDVEGRYRRLHHWLWNGVRVWRIIRSESPDIVHFNDIRPAEQAWLAPLSAQWSVILNVRDVKPAGDGYGMKWKLVLRAVDHVLTLSAEMQRELGSRLGVQPLSARDSGGAPVRTYRGGVGGRRSGRRRRMRSQLHKAETSYIYSAVSWEGVGNNGGLQEAPRPPGGAGGVAYVGAVCEKKGQLEFLRHAVPALLENPGCAVLFLGDFRPEAGPYARACQEHARSLSGHDRVKFMGSVGDVRKWLRNVDVTVLASKNEGLARSMIESVSCGTPMVSFDVCSAREILECYGAGIVVPQGDYAGLVGAIRAVVEDRALREGMGRRGMSAGRELFDVESVRARYMALCHSLRRGGRDG